ncbi:serine protease snake-like [Zophobas morio]|uniref:serine protease snake-like n=1 Tax=Zophobas morio TaxID=2755281 RepID=UPI00308345B7
MSFVLTVFTIIVLVDFASSQQFVGDVCTLRSTKSPGVCKLFNDCEKAREALQQRRFPQTCGFQGKQPIVCCPQNQTVTENTPPRRSPGDISKKKCQEYSRYVYESPDAVQLIIAGGVAADRKEFPHMTAVGYEPTPGDLQWLCGGTILSNNFVLTAAHCLTDINAGNAIRVKLGVNQLTDQRQEVRIADRIVHPDYRANSHYHDIGLLKLEKPAKMNPYARPACLYLSPNITVQSAIATGWGQTSWVGEGSNDLLKVTLNLFDWNVCKGFYKNQRKLSRGILNDIQFCAGSMTEEKDTCKGDSGGPLQIYHTGDEVLEMYDIIGITSFGKGCAGSPGVYVRVSNYIQWIEDIVWP